MRRIIPAVLLLAACGNEQPQLIAGNRALLVDVASDQGWAALLEHDAAYPDGTHLGTLVVQPLDGNAPLTLAEKSDGGTFSRGRALWFHANASVVTAGTPPATSVWGQLMLWLPGMNAPIVVGTNVRDFHPSLDGSSVVFLDYATPSDTATARFVALSSTTCGTGTCSPVVLATSVLADEAAWSISDDGKYVFATIRGGLTGDPGAAMLVQPATGEVDVLSTAAGSRSATMTPAGDAVAWVEAYARVMTATTADLTMAPIANTAQWVESIAMVTPKDFVAKVRPMSATGTLGAASLSRINAAGTTPLGIDKPLDVVISLAVPGVTNTLALYSTAQDMTTGAIDVWALPLDHAGAPLQLAFAAPSPLAAGLQFSDDGSMLSWRDGIDSTATAMTGIGDLYAAPTAKLGLTLVTSSVRGGAFEPGNTRMLYISAPDATTDAGVLTLLPKPGAPTLVEGVGRINFVNTRAEPFRTFYTQRDGSADDGVWTIAQP